MGMTDLIHSPDALAEAKRRKLEALLRQRSSEPRDLPLSVGQERLHRLVQLSPDQPFYNVAVAYRLRGELDPSAMERAVLRIAERHHVLRAVFMQVDGRLVQRIAPRPPDGLFALTRVEAASLDSALAEEAARPFDLTTAPLWRVRLFRLGDDDHALTLVMHHIVTDGWSFELLLRELGALTSAYARAAPDPLAPSPVQYAAYAERQRAGFAEPAFAAQQAYWRQHLEGRIPALVLPTDLQDGAGDERRAASAPLALPDGLGAQLSALGKREGVSSFMIALTAFAAMLHRWSGQTDMVVCTPVAGRHRAQSREVVGYCNNILPIRLDMSGDPTLGELLRRVRAVTLDAYKNQDVPFQEIADAPGLRRIPLSRLLFSVDMPWPPELSVEGLRCAPTPIETGAADFDFSVSLWPEGEGLAGTLRYKTSLFSEKRVRAIGESFCATLGAMTEALERPISELPTALVGAVSGAASGVPGSHSVSPRFPLEEKLARIWRAAFDQREIGVFDDFRKIGASSLAVASLSERLERELGIAIDLPDLFRAGTIARMCEILEMKDSGLGADPLAPIRPEGSRAPLFLFEGVSVYYPLTDRLPAEQPVYGLVRPVVSDFRNVEDMAASYVDAILKVRPSGPYHLGGLSFGGLVAFEAAQQLSAMGAEIGIVALFDTPGPNAHRRKSLAGRTLGHVGNTLTYGLPYLSLKLGHRLKAKRSGLGSTEGEGAADGNAALDPAAQRRAFARYAAHYEVKPFPGRIILFKLSERNGMTDSMFDPALHHIDPLLGWGAVARGGLEVFDVGGDHIGMLKEPNVAMVATHLERFLSS